MSEIERINLDQVVRALGERWARRVRTERNLAGRNVGPWPQSIEHARKLLDDILGAHVSGELRESLVLLLDRSARAAWHRASGYKPEAM
jgi:hypothetical protein